MTTQLLHKHLVQLLPAVYRLSVATALGFFLFSSSALPATYNFYFNNTEQGDNSTTTPTIVVKDGKIESVDKNALPQEPSTVAGQPAPEPAPLPTAAPEPAKSASVYEFKPEPEHKFRHWRFASGLVAGEVTRQRQSWSSSTAWSSSSSSTSWDSGASSSYSYDSGSSYSSSSTSSMTSLALSVSAFPIPQLGATVFLGGISGTELDVVPFHFGDDRVELGAAFGWSKYWDDASIGMTPHLAVKFGVNFSEHWGMQVVGRASLANSDKDFKYATGETALVLRL